MQFIVVKISIEWDREDGDGTECYLCGDACWLNQHRLMAIVNGKRNPTGTVLCESCRDATRELLEDEE